MRKSTGTQAAPTVRMQSALLLTTVLLFGCDRRSDWSANQAISAQLTDAAVRQSKEYDEQLKRIDEQLRVADEQNRRFDEQLRKADEQYRRFDALLDKWLEQADRTDRLIERWERFTSILEERVDAAGPHAQPLAEGDE